MELERGGRVEEIVFGTRDVVAIDSVIDSFCVAEFGSEIAEVLFRAASVGVVVGVRLRDERRVVVKVHQPRETRARLQAVHELQQTLFAAGLPCPQPLIGPVKLAGGHAVAEALLDTGQARDTHNPACRQLLAEMLAWHLEVTARHSGPGGLAGGWSLFDGDGLWPRHAHAPVFDFEAAGEGAAWIDDLATRAKRMIEPDGLPLVGHSDWSGKHFRFANDSITAIYDWDSLAVRTEAQIVGVAAMTFTTNFALPNVKRAPTPDESRAFIDEYSTVRDTPLTIARRQQIAACGLLLGAYIARCEHCAVDGYLADEGPESFTAALREHGLGYLQA